MRSAAIHARVSTDDKDVTRQLDEYREYIAAQLPPVEDPAIDVYRNVIPQHD